MPSLSLATMRLHIMVSTTFDTCAVVAVFVLQLVSICKSVSTFNLLQLLKLLHADIAYAMCLCVCREVCTVEGCAVRVIFSRVLRE